ncbi:hypothetical protein HaLaN_02318 [Haematococcus lacustris]|uniref:Uncharacterized protein n=1 Tax=Haematococcus lacustris TaxID=44745 RepID=A0A699YKR0_HAELA|nr:hypothetical protein HaLaN_02318 [Haematococcus lacustris]
MAAKDGEEEVSLSPELVEEAGGAAPAGFGQTSCLWSCGLPLSAKSVRSRLWLRVVGESCETEPPRPKPSSL